MDREAGRLARPLTWTSAKGFPSDRVGTGSDRVAIALPAGNDTRLIGCRSQSRVHVHVMPPISVEKRASGCSLQSESGPQRDLA